MTPDHLFLLVMALVIIGMEVVLAVTLTRLREARLALRMAVKANHALCRDCALVGRLQTQARQLDAAWSTIDEMRKAEREANRV